MRLATIRRPQGGTRAVRVDRGGLVDLGADDVGALLRAGNLGIAETLIERPTPVVEADFAPLIPDPGKVICVGLNYRSHILELGLALPEYPTLFAKFADCLIGAGDPIRRPAETGQLDWEAELAVVIGHRVRRADKAAAAAAIAGFTVLNDVTCRDWQARTAQWLQGKCWPATTPVGPFLVTPDELPGGVRPVLDVRTEVDGEVMQSHTTADLLFDPVSLVAYISTIVALNPGDIIATGTPGGVGHARSPARYLIPGQRLVTQISGLGRLDNLVVED